MLAKFNSIQSDGWIVAVLAPTGMAAYNVSGQTIHRFFKLPIFTKTTKSHWARHEKTVKAIREFTKNIKIIIIGNY